MSLKNRVDRVEGKANEKQRAGKVYRRAIILEERDFASKAEFEAAAEAAHAEGRMVVMVMRAQKPVL